jgi:hypothetical protein
MERRIDLESTNLLTLSIEALNNLLFNESILVEDEDALFRLVLNLVRRYLRLLRYMEIGFLE